DCTMNANAAGFDSDHRGILRPIDCDHGTRRRYHSTRIRASGRRHRRDRRELYPEGVASGDPDDHSVILWTRRPYETGTASARLRVEVARDKAFAHVVASGEAPVLAASDWTCRILVGGLDPATVYWYRFTDR